MAYVLPCSLWLYTYQGQQMAYVLAHYGYTYHGQQMAYVLVLTMATLTTGSR